MEQFITSLYNVVETCDFGGLKNKMICDTIVVGIHDQALSERLQWQTSTWRRPKPLSGKEKQHTSINSL